MGSPYNLLIPIDYMDLITLLVLLTNCNKLVSQSTTSWKACQYLILILRGVSNLGLILKLVLK